MPRAEKPTESRLEPVPMVGLGLKPVVQSVVLTVHGDVPRSTTLFELCEPPSVTFHPNCGRSRMLAVSVASRPEFFTEPALTVRVSDDGPADDAIGRLINASFVTLL